MLLNLLNCIFKMGTMINFILMIFIIIWKMDNKGYYGNGVYL